MIKDLQDGHPKWVIAAAKKWTKANHLNPLMPQVLLLQGDAEVLRGMKYRALYSYEDLLNNYPTSELYLPVLEREYNIADAFLNGYKRTFLGLRILPVTDDALELLGRIQDRQPRQAAVAERAGFVRRRLLLQCRKIPPRPSTVIPISSPATATHNTPVRPKSAVPKPRSRIFAESFTTSPPCMMPANASPRSPTCFPNPPSSFRPAPIDDRIYQLEGENELEVARYYYRAGKKHASAYYYRRVIANWPDTSFAESARKELLTKLLRGARPMNPSRSPSTTLFPPSAFSIQHSAFSTPAVLWIPHLRGVPPIPQLLRLLHAPAVQPGLSHHRRPDFFANKSFRREWEFRLTEALDKNIEFRTPYKIVSQDRADTVLTGEIVDLDENVLTQAPPRHQSPVRESQN